MGCSACVGHSPKNDDDVMNGMPIVCFQFFSHYEHSHCEGLTIDGPREDAGKEKASGDAEMLASPRGQLPEARNT